ncbi:HAD hydrolase-like protein [archaeon]|nr:HAD hydrolase-like protein [archaeon]
MIKSIIFDWDDVITLGSKEGYFACYHAALVGVELSPEEEEKRILAKWGKSHREELKELLKENLHLLDKACDIYEERLSGDTFVNCLSIVEGVSELLSRISRKYMLSVATGMNPEILKEKIMPKFNIPQVFTHIISAYDIKDPDMQKPHPYSINYILEKQGIRPENAIMVGDARGDVLMARAAGVTPVVVLTGHLSRGEAEDLGVRYIISDITKIEKVLYEIDG